MSGYPDFAPGAIVVSLSDLNDGAAVVAPKNFTGEVEDQDGPWVAVTGLPGNFHSGCFREATAVEAEAFKLMPSIIVAPLKETSNPLRPAILYGWPNLPAGFVLPYEPSIGDLGLLQENRNLNAWLVDEQRIKLDLRRQLAAAQDEITELRGALAKEVV